MSPTATSPDTSSGRPPRSAGRWAVVGLFMLLAAGFVLRLVQNGYHWFRGTVSPDVNYKALTVWCLIYAVVCAGIAAFAYWLPAEGDESAGR